MRVGSLGLVPWSIEADARAEEIGDWGLTADNLPTENVLLKMAGDDLLCRAVGYTPAQLLNLAGEIPRAEAHSEMTISAMY